MPNQHLSLVPNGLHRVLQLFLTFYLVNSRVPFLASTDGATLRLVVVREKENGRSGGSPISSSGSRHFLYVQFYYVARNITGWIKG